MPDRIGCSWLALAMVLGITLPALAQDAPTLDDARAPDDVTAPDGATAPDPVPTSENEPAPQDAAPGVRVVLVGRVARSAELRLVLYELLDRRGMAVDFESEDRFRARVFLSAGHEDPAPAMA